jgi:hypothetical protein
MHRFRNRLIAVAIASALALPLIGVKPAEAVPAGNGCNASGVPAALISWYPAQPAAQSALKVACTFNNNTGTSQVSASFTIHDMNQALWHNAAARTVTTSGVTASGATTIQLSTASNGIAGLPVSPTQMNRVISGTGIAVRTNVDSMTAGGLLTLNRATTASIPSGTALKIENGTARTILDGAGVATTTLTSPADANFTAADVGCSVSGTGIPANTTITAVGSATTATLSATFTLTGPTVTICGSQVNGAARQITGASTTSAVRINSSAAAWVSSDIGLKVVGVCDQGTAAGGDDYTIPANTYILNTPSGANADTTGGLTTGQTGCNLTIGDPGATAPDDGDTAAHQGVQLNLNPSLVAGSDDCTNDQPEGFATIAAWYNPGSFQPSAGAGFTTAQPGRAVAFQPTFATKAIGQLYFDTAVADFAAFVIEKKALSVTPNGAADPIGSSHYDVMFPFVPTGLALCPSTTTSPGLGFSLTTLASTASIATQPSGTGRPGTGQLRSILPQTSGGYTATAYVMSDHATIAFSPASAFNRVCIYPTGLPNPVNMQCGPG